MDPSFPFDLGGHRYMARVRATRPNPDGDPNHPQGLHKGITVYNAELTSRFARLRPTDEAAIKECKRPPRAKHA